MESKTNQAWRLKSYPTGMVTSQNFYLQDIAYPTDPAEKEVLIQLIFLSVDPYMRGKLNNQKGHYSGGFEIGKSLDGGAVGRVLKTNDESFKEGDYVQGFFQFELFQVVKVGTFEKIPDIPGVPLHYFLGILGLTGLSAYIPLIKIGKPEKGETLFVSGAAGAVGSVVGQIGQILGLKVVGSAGTDDKIEFLKSIGFDAVYNYKKKSTDQFLKESCPQGVNIYFDNVGGEILDQTLLNMKTNGRIVVCGSISQYNSVEKYGVQNLSTVITKSLTIQGFLFFNFVKEIPERRLELAKWVSEGKLVSKETIYKGFEQTIQAFVGLFTGDNTGKVIIEL